MLAALAGGVGAARFLPGLVRAVPPAEIVAIVNTADDDEFHGLLRLPRPRLGHLHARRRVQPRAGLGPRRRDVRDPRRARALRRPTPGSGSATRTSPRTSSAPSACAAGATLSEVTAEIAARLGPRGPPAPDDRRPASRTRITVRDAATARPRELAMQEWFVRERAEPPVVARATSTAPNGRGPRPGVLDALRSADTDASSARRTR